MRLTAENKAKVRKRILVGAASVMRQRGFNDVNLDDVMREAGLTRGAFYAHFTSKADLFAAIAREEHPLLVMLRERNGRTSSELWQQLLAIFEDYLNPDHLEKIFTGCTIASLTGDVTRADTPVRQAFDQAWNDIRREFDRGQNNPAPAQTIDAALTLATGAISTAMACSEPETRKSILNAAWVGFSQLLAHKF